MIKRTARVMRGLTAGGVALSILFAAPGCAKFSSIMNRPAQATNASPRGAEDTAYFEPGASVDGSRNPSRAPQHATPGVAADETMLTSADPHFADEAPVPDASQTVNVFGETGGVERGPAKPVGESGFQQHTSVDEGEDGDVTVDPTGRWLAFSSSRHNEAGDIYLQRVDGTSVTQLTNDAARDAYPAFSPDGKWIAFSSTRAGTWQIYRMDLDGRNVVQVTSGPMQAIHPSFSPDGGRLVYSAMGSRSRQWELWTVDLLSGERRQIGYGLFPNWSPDKTADRIAYQRARQRGSRWFSLWTMDLVNGEGRRMTEVAVSSNAALVAPCWSPDGKKLAFTTVVQPAKGAKAGQQDVWTVDADGANKQRLTDGNGTNLTPAWAIDNRVYFVSDRGGNESVWSIQSDPSDAFTTSISRAPKAPTQETADTKEVGR